MESTEVQELRYDKVIDLAQERFTKMAPKQMLFDAEKGYAVQLLGNNDYLMKVAMNDKASLVQAITNVAAIGLSLNPAKKQAYLVPRGGRICLDPSYMGMCDMATASGAIEWLQANVVYSNDKFMDNGPGIRPSHEYEAFKPISDRGEFAGVYCVAKTHNGDYLTTIMTKPEIDDIKGRSELGKKNAGPWKSDFNEMAKKTVVRRAFKMLPKSESLDRLALAVELSNQNEEFEPIITNPDIGQYTEDQKKYFDQLLTENKFIELFLFTKDIDESVFTSLYNSFEQGQKGKFKALIDALMEKGRVTLNECVEALNAAADNNNEVGIDEILENAEPNEIAYYHDNCHEEYRDMIRTMTKG